MHAPLFGQHVCNLWVMLILPQQTLKQRQTAVVEAYEVQASFAYCRHLWSLLYHCGQLSVVAYHNHLFYGAHAAVSYTQNAYDVRFEYLRSLVYHSQVKMLMLQQFNVCAQ